MLKKEIVGYVDSDGSSESSHHHECLYAVILRYEIFPTLKYFLETRDVVFVDEFPAYIDSSTEGVPSIQ